MGFQIQGLSPQPFQTLFALSDEVLAGRHIQRSIADKKPGFPCRVSLADAEIGEELLLLPHEHLPVASPYRSGGAIYVRRQAQASYVSQNEVPELLHVRVLSVRAYDADGMMRMGEVCQGASLALVIERMFANHGVAYLHAHTASRGCFLCRIDRVVG